MVLEWTMSIASRSPGPPSRRVAHAFGVPLVAQRIVKT